MNVLLKTANRRVWGMGAACVVVVFFQVWLAMLFPKYLQEVSSLLKIPGVEMNSIIPVVWRMFLCSCGVVITGALSAALAAAWSSAQTMQTRDALFGKIVSCSPGELSSYTTSSLISRCTYDIAQLQTFLTAVPQSLVYAPLVGISTVIVLMKQNLVWTAITVITVVSTVATLMYLIAKITPKSYLIAQHTDSLSRLAMEHISGLRMVHAYNAYDYHQDHFHRKNEEFTAANIYINSKMSFLGPVFAFFQNIGDFAIYLTGAGMVMASAAAMKLPTFSGMIAAAYYNGQAILTFIIVTVVLIQLPSTLASVRRISEVLSEEIKIVDGAGVGSDGTPGTLEFRNVSFRYPGSAADALHGISFTVERGTTAAIIGATGSGKTSLLNLVARLYDASEGTVLVDGHDVRDFVLDDLRSRIGYVPQKSLLFTGTIEGNINYGENTRFQAAIAEIKKAAEAGQAKEFIEKTPLGYQSQVEHGGMNFSGGQRQRLAISRAICRNPEIYLFDDSFSALDLKTDRQLRASLKQVSSGATVLIVAQRISTIRDADKIIVLDKGCVAGQGSHKELLETCPVYREIAESQSDGR